MKWWHVSEGWAAASPSLAAACLCGCPFDPSVLPAFRELFPLGRDNYCDPGVPLGQTRVLMTKVCRALFTQAL